MLIFANPYILKAQTKSDSSSIYKKIEKKSQKFKVTKWLYHSIFNDKYITDKDGPSIVIQKKLRNPFVSYKGYMVRNISIVVLDPFGYSVNEFYGKSLDRFEILGNKYHITTKEIIIKNLLLFKANETLDPLELSESERILRLSPYIYDARIYVQKTIAAVNDSVDVLVVVQDKWTITATSGFDINAPDITIYDKNIIGLGNQYTQDVFWNASDKYVSTAGKYSIYNIKRSFITATALYNTAKEHQKIGLSFERLFYSPLARWAGGISYVINDSFNKQTNIEQNTTQTYNIRFNTFDVWSAHSFPLSQNKSSSINKRTSNLVLGARYFKVNYFDRPSFAIDSNLINRDQSLYLANFGFSQRKYYRDRYLFRYGANEDIPEGVSSEILFGVMKKEITSLWYYTGFKVGIGQHIEDVGYLSGSLAYGTFYRHDNIGLSVLNLDAMYFTDLIKKQKWYFRQFIRFKLVEGFDREKYEYLNINGGQMYGFSSPALIGNSKMLLNFEFVMYAPYKLLGFQFAPVIFVGFAGLADNFGGILSNTIYESYAIGLLIRNEYLLSNTFQFSIGLYPFMPGNPAFSIKGNPIGNYDVRARDYFISKPDLVSYQ